MTRTRSIPPSLAPVLTELELMRPAVVTSAGLTKLLQQLGQSITAKRAAARLRELGWLLPLRSRGVWEFAPADRAGALHGGDTFIELRAALAARPQLRIGVGFDSAAFLRGLSTRQSTREVIVVEPGTARLPAHSEFRRVELALPAPAYSEMNGLRVQTSTGIIAAIAIRPDGFADWPGLGEWLTVAVNHVDAAQLRSFLTGRSPAAWARAAYLLYAGGASSAAETITLAGPPGKGPFYLGPRQPGGHHDATTRVIDTVVHRYVTARQGSS
ncbi:MAG: type IV toxin-antitoxin system AbiEi family antitoxin [Mycobacteriales bacterium]